MTRQKKCFVIMPFGKQGTPEHTHNTKIYELMIKPVVKACGYEPIRSDELPRPGSITRDIIQLLLNADLVIADLSGKNASVFYELGVRHTLFRCGTIAVVPKGEGLPFDIKDYRVVYYSSELDEPQEFKKELELRIKTFENIPKDQSDNPVYDALSDNLQFQNLAEKASLLKKISELEQELKQAKEAFAPRAEMKAAVAKSKRFRSEPKILSENDVKRMLKEFDFYHSTWNTTGHGFANQYRAETIKGDKVVFDGATGLMWHQNGSSKYMGDEEAKNWIKDLNEKGYAGYQDWRLPTLEEAMSLMETNKINFDLYIDPVFDNTQRYIWTSDTVSGAAGLQWVVYFSDGHCSYYGLYYYYYYVRAVRSEQSDRSD